MTKFNENFSEFQNECKITFVRNGKTLMMTTKEYKNMLRAEKAKAAKKAQINEIKLLPADIKALMKNVKVLKSITAYYHHGYRQWGRIAKSIITAPTIASPFLNVVLRTKEVNDKIAEIETIGKKGEKAVFQYVEKLQYLLDDLQKHLDDLLFSITKSGVLSSAIQQHECISGEGRRLGLRILVQRGDKAISEIGRIIATLGEITRNGVDPMHYTQNGKLSA